MQECIVDNRSWYEIRDFYLDGNRRGRERKDAVLRLIEKIRNSCREKSKESVREQILFCAKDYIKYGTHASFGELCFNMCQKKTNNTWNRSNLFPLIYDELVREYIDKTKGINNQLRGRRSFEIIDTLFWRSPDFQYTRENIDKVKVSASLINKWSTGINFPDREAIIQLGLIIGLDVKKVNMLLQASGNPVLYYVDLCDAISMYQLETYQDDFSLSPYEKLKTTKDLINTYLKQPGFSDVYYEPYLQDSVISTEEFEEKCRETGLFNKINDISFIRWEKGIPTFQPDSINEEKVQYIEGFGITINDYGIIMISRNKRKVHIKKYVTGKKWELFRNDRFNSLKEEKAAWPIDEEIKRIRKANSSYGRNNQRTNVSFVTQMMADQKKNGISLNDYVKNAVQDGRSIFNINRYGYLQGILYLLDNYIPNKSNQVVMSEGLEKLTDQLYARIIDPEDRWSTMESREQVLKSWKRRFEEVGGRNLSSKNLVYWLKGRCHSLRLEDGTKSVLYEKINIKKDQLIKVLSVAEGDDQVAKLMKGSGYWEKDLTVLEELPEIMDLEDAILVYVFLCKKLIIEESLKKNSDKNGRHRIILSKRFPFFALMKDICRDIQFTICIELYADKDINTLSDRENDLLGKVSLQMPFWNDEDIEYWSRIFGRK